MTRYQHTRAYRTNWLRTAEIPTWETYAPDGVTVDQDTPEWAAMVRAHRAAARKASNRDGDMPFGLVADPKPLRGGYEGQYAPRPIIGVYSDVAQHAAPWGEPRCATCGRRPGWDGHALRECATVAGTERARREAFQRAREAAREARAAGGAR